MSLKSVQLSALLRTVIFVLLFVAGVLVYLPWGMGIFRLRDQLDWHATGLIPLALGTYIVIRCAFAFAWEGHGTPAPFDAPRELVAVGVYRYVRNPMYWGALLILAGQGLLFGTGWGAPLYMAIFYLCVHTFVIAYEEPTLRRKFGESYEDYCRQVPRWIPRSSAWVKGR